MADGSPYRILDGGNTFHAIHVMEEVASIGYT